MFVFKFHIYFQYRPSFTFRYPLVGVRTLVLLLDPGTVESTYKSPVYKSLSGYKSRCPLDGICPFFVCIKKEAVQVASIASKFRLQVATRVHSQCIHC